MFNFHERLSRLEVLGSQQIVQGAWIMGDWKLKVLIFFIFFLEISKKRREFLTKGGWKLTEHLENALSHLDCMTDLQGNHGYGNFRTEYNRGGLRINQNVELRCWTPVSKPNGSSHHGYSTYFLTNVRKGSQNNRQISHSSSDYKLNLFILSHNLVVDMQERLFFNSRLWRFEELCSFQATCSMNFSGSFQFSTKRP